MVSVATSPLLMMCRNPLKYHGTPEEFNPMTVLGIRRRAEKLRTDERVGTTILQEPVKELGSG
jgi:hypothetical protein